MTYDPRYPLQPTIAQQEHMQRMMRHMELETAKREAEQAKQAAQKANERATIAVAVWQQELTSALRAMVQLLADIKRRSDEMVTFQKSRGRTIVLDKKTGKPKAKTSGMNASKRAAIAKSKKVRVTRKTKGAQRP